MRKFVLAAAVLVVALTITAVAITATSPKLTTFGTGDVFANGNKAATFNDSGEYGGVYRTKTSNRLLTDSAIDLEFTNLRAVGGGAPRFSIPIDEGDHTTDAYAFMDVNGCGSNVVSTESSTCQVFYKSGVWPNWDAFAASLAHTGWRIARKEQVGTKPNGNPIYQNTQPFVIADVQGDYLVTDVVLAY